LGQFPRGDTLVCFHETPASDFWQVAFFAPAADFEARWRRLPSRNRDFQKGGWMWILVGGGLHKRGVNMTDGSERFDIRRPVGSAAGACRYLWTRLGHGCCRMGRFFEIYDLFMDLRMSVLPSAAVLTESHGKACRGFPTRPGLLPSRSGQDLAGLAITQSAGRRGGANANL